MDSLYAAVAFGADEVYLGVGGFNARNNIEGFTLETLAEAVDYAHTFGVKVCLTLNILLRDEELQEAVDLLVDAYDMGVDAFIVQDLGLAAEVHKRAPEVVLHASTQMGIHNLEGVEAVLPFGFRRVVLARETPLSEIRRIKDNASVEIEYFAQGALCVCFSGNCYLSERVCDASGNRGRCKQLCRLPYALEKDGKVLKRGYLLSAKDFCMIDRLSDLAAAGVDVLKIEGRARRPSYVGMTTAEYRKALDGQTPDRERLALAFNRLYTAGYFDGNGEIISPYQSHIGVAVGEVVQVNHGKRFDEVYFRADRPITPRSALKFFVDGQEECTVSAFDLKQEGGVYRLTTTAKVSVGATVSLITDAEAEKAVLADRRRDVVDIALCVRAGEPLLAKFAVDGKDYAFEGPVAQAAVNQPLAERDFADNFAKSDLFEAKVSFDALEAVFLPKKQLNEFRRGVFAEIKAIRLAPYKRRLAHWTVEPMAFPSYAPYAVTERPEYIPEGDRVVYDPADYRLADVKAFAQACREKGAVPYLALPNFATKEDVDFLKEMIAAGGVGVLANNYYALTLGAGRDVLVGAGLNAYNAHAANALGLPLAAGEMPYMTLRHCPMKCLVGGDCAHCRYAEGYVYVMDGGKRLRLTRKKVATCTFYLE